MTRGTAQAARSGQHSAAAGRPTPGPAPADPPVDQTKPADVDQVDQVDQGDQTRADRLDRQEQELREREEALSRREQGQTAAGRAQLAEQDARAADDGRRRYTLELVDGTEVQSDTGESFTLVLADGSRVHSETLVSTHHAAEEGGQAIPVVSVYADEIKSRRDNSA